MATLKAGTYRFNDVLTAPSGDLEQSVNFTANAVYIPDGVEYFATGNSLSVYVYAIALSYNIISANPSNTDLVGEKNVYIGAEGNLFVGWNPYLSEGIKTITIPEDTEVTAEFYEWFTANVVEVVEHTVSGVWKFKDVLSVPSDTITQDINFVVTGVNGSRIYITVTDSSDNIHPIFQYVNSELNLRVYGETQYWRTDDFGEGIKTIDFGTEPQTVSAEFYEWLTANATQPTATIQYNGSAIANLFGGQTATLKCEGMKMESDVTVKVAEQTGGECNHEVYDLSTGYNEKFSVRAKSIIARPTDEQIAQFVNGKIALITADVEHLYGICEASYKTMTISEGVTFTPLYIRNAAQSISMYYIWADEVTIAQAVVSSMGGDATAITGEGWYSMGAVFEPVSDEVLQNINFEVMDMFVCPYGDYWYSLFDYYADDERKAPAAVVVKEGRYDNISLATADTLCKQDIIVKGKGMDNVGVIDKEHGMTIDGYDESREHDKIGYITCDFVGENPSLFHLEVTSFTHLGMIYQAAWHQLSSERLTIEVARYNVIGVTIAADNTIGTIETVYTNATIVSQSETEVYISGIRHDTHIVVFGSVGK